ncbi:MAG: hypothetical protein HYS12_26140 [Planctomycetes bacterium]|nr:hypothetical protein [Planctomycetota bacterium]
MRTRGLRWAGVLLAWAALTPSVGRTQTCTSGQTSPWWNRWAAVPSVGQVSNLPLLPGRLETCPTDGRLETCPTDGGPSGFLPDDGLPPSVVRGQIDTAAGYAPPEPNLALPLGSTRPESGWFFHGSFLLYEQTVPLRNQVVARRGFVDTDGLITATGVGTPVGSFATALQVNQVRGPRSFQPGFEAGFGYRFQDGSAIDFDWWYIVNTRYTAVATLVPPFQLLDQALANTFLFSPVINFPADFGGPPNRINDINGGPFGIWNAASLETLQYTQRTQEFELTYRKPIFETECWRTYGLIGPSFVWFWERFGWRTIAQDTAGDPANLADEALYTNIISNRMYGAKLGIGNECYLGHGFSTSLDLQAGIYLDVIRERAKYERGDFKEGGPANKRSRTDWTGVPAARGTLNLWWYPYEGIQMKIGYDVQTFFNTVSSKNPIDFDYSALTPKYDRIFVRFLDGLNIGLSLSF